jgi:UrcA family protein
MQRDLIAIGFSAAILIGLAGGTAAASTAVQSRPGPGPMTTYITKVSYADLNLEKDVDAAIMLRRIDRAARKVCKAGARPLPVYLQRQINDCVEVAANQAVASLDAPVVTALFRDRAEPIRLARGGEAG